MKKVLFSLVTIFLLVLSLVSTISTAKADDEYDIEIADENNLAAWKYDWDVVNIGAGNTNFDNGYLRMENINLGTANYALLETHKFNEFKLDFYANLNLLSPSDFDLEGNDWCNLYLTFFIDYEDASVVENVAQAACPWTFNKGWFSICFERIAGASHIQMLVNESFDGKGSNRYFQQGTTVGEGCTTANIDWCDNKYHWYTITGEAVQSKNPSRPRPAEEGMIFTVYIDGVKQTSWFRSNVYFSNTKGEEEIIPFNSQKGYFGFWASSSFTANYTTENTGVAVDIKELQVTSYDGLTDKSTATPYTKCPKPPVNLNEVTYTPQASYNVNEEFEIKISDLFSYDGDNKLTYTATYKGNNIGTVRNGYFVWEPEAAGAYVITFTATDGEVTATNEIRFKVVEVEEEEPVTKTTAKVEKEKTVTETKGCNSSVALSITLILPIALGTVIIASKRKENE